MACDSRTKFIETVKQIEPFGEYHMTESSATFTINKNEAQQHVDKVYISLEEFQDYQSFTLTNSLEEISVYFLPVPADKNIKCETRSKPICLDETLTFNTSDYDMTNTYIVFKKNTDDIFFYCHHRKSFPVYNLWLLFVVCTFGAFCYSAYLSDYLSMFYQFE